MYVTVSMQVEVLSPRENGSAVEFDEESTSSTHKSKRSSIIRGMWKKAFKSLKGEKPNKGEKENEKDEKQDFPQDKQCHKQVRVIDFLHAWI